MDALHEKKRALEEYLWGLGSLAVAYSAGVDSTFLLAAAHETLGDKVLAVTARSVLCPARETEEAEAFCRVRGIEHIVLDYDALAVPGVKDNPPDRCYRCKKALFGEILEAAHARGIEHVAEGSNADDEGDYRPGMKAVAELGILSPLRQVRLTKEEIRALSREMGLDTWDKPSMACLASRFVYGETLTPEKLQMVAQAEQKLRDWGFSQMRVRVHGDLARVEVLPEEFARLIVHAGELDEYLRGLGFAYAALDLAGYKTGSMNRTL